MTDSGAGRELILSGKMEAGYEKFYATFVPVVFETGKGYRLEESNSLFHGGATNISTTAASALWGLGFRVVVGDAWGGRGINFHTGMNAAGEGRVPGGYDLFWRPPERIEVHPMGYGVKTFDVAGGGGVCMGVAGGGGEWGWGECDCVSGGGRVCSVSDVD